MYRTTIHDPEFGAPRVYGYGRTADKSQQKAYKALSEYMRTTDRWRHRPAGEVWPVKTEKVA